MKYKLIKTYPGSPELGYVVIKETLNWSQLKDYPEFWKLVIEYPVGTKVLNSETKSIYTKKEDGWYMLDRTAYTDEQITKSKHINIISEPVIEKDYEILDTNIDDNLKQTIHSIKRKSDSEMFTIGDRIANMCNSEQNITELYINKDGKMCVYTSTTCRFTIDNIKKVKTPLFTTEDGVDIFEGDNFTRVNVGKWEIWCENEIGVTKNYANKEYWDKIGILHFSTKEKAEEYILLNKPVLSLQDIYNISSSYYLGRNMRKPSLIVAKYRKKDLENLVKQKLNK